LFTHAEAEGQAGQEGTLGQAGIAAGVGQAGRFTFTKSKFPEYAK
jgi:hypothetical protein